MPNYHPPTLVKHDLFFAELARHGLVTTAANAADLDRSSVYKLKDKDPEFAERWTKALETYVDGLEAAAHQRAVVGTDKGVWHQGVLVGTERKYSDSLLALMLKAKRKREYGDSSKVELTGADGGPVKIEESPTEIGRRIAFAMAVALRAKEQQATVEPADGSDLA